MKYLLNIVFILFFGLNSKSSEYFYTDFTFGVKAGLSQIEHNALFENLPAVPNCCVPFENSRNFGINLGIFINKDFFSYINLELVGSFKYLPAKFAAREFIGYTEFNSLTYELYSIHKLDASIGYFSINPEIFIKPIPAFPLKIGFGGDIGTFMPKSFEQREELDPDAVSKGITFYDGSRQTTVKNIQKGELPVSALQTFFNVSAEYSLMISDNLYISPSLRFNFGMNNIIKIIDWKMNSVSLDVSLSFPQLTQRIDTTEDKYEQSIINYDSLISVLNNEMNKLKHMKDNFKFPYEYKYGQYKINPLIDAFSNRLSNETEEKDQIISLNDERKSEGCCKIIIISSTNKKYSEKSLSKIMKSGLTGIKIEKWLNIDNNMIYYRVVSDCFSDSESAQIRKREIRNQILELVPESEMYIKCEHE